MPGYFYLLSYNYSIFSFHYCYFIIMTNLYKRYHLYSLFAIAHSHCIIWPAAIYVENLELKETIHYHIYSKKRGCVEAEWFYFFKRQFWLWIFIICHIKIETISFVHLCTKKAHQKFEKYLQNYVSLFIWSSSKKFDATDYHGFQMRALIYACKFMDRKIQFDMVWNWTVFAVVCRIVIRYSALKDRHKVRLASKWLKKGR